MSLRYSSQALAGVLIAGVILCASAAACRSNGATESATPDVPVATVVQTVAGTAAATPSPQSTRIDEPPTQTPVGPTQTASPTSSAPAFARHFVDNEDCSTISRAPLPVTTVSIVGDGHSFTVHAEVATTGEQKQQGLMCRESLARGTGMLFAYDSPSSGGYWMFNTYVPLDILYVAPDGAVVSVASMAPCARNEAENRSNWQSRCAAESSGYRPAGPYIATLELPAGWLESNGFDSAIAGGITVHWSQ